MSAAALFSKFGHNKSGAATTHPKSIERKKAHGKFDFQLLQNDMMPRLSLFLFCFIFSSTAFAQHDYFFPGKSNFDTKIPSPEQFLGYPIGEWHTRHDKIVAYMEKLAELSDRATVQYIGYTYERRAQVVLTVTSPQNQSNLESIRTEHLKLTDPAQPMPDISNLPAIIHLGYNVHGNEPSSAEAALLTAWYLVASNEPAAEEYRQKAIIHVEPSLNPDGRDRHANWANMHKGFPPVADPIDREHNEVWPGGRTNHYWYDMNRDWLPLAHPESQNRIDWHQKWYPNMVTDFHEMGTNSTYFFEPTKPYGSENPVVGRKNYDVLNPLMAKYFHESLDEIGSLYFLREQYDNSYPGYGATYSDIHGGLGVTFEQASSRGHLQKTSTKDITFAFTIRNHLATSLATVEGVVKEKEIFQRHMREFFEESVQQGAADPVKAWVFGDQYDTGRTKAFLDLLLRHRIKVYENPSSQNIAGQRFEAGKSYLVPSHQRQYRMVRSVFEKVKQFDDSVFYDASTWTMVLAYGLPHAEMRGKAPSLGREVTAVPEAANSVEKAAYAYLLDWREYFAPKALYHLLKNGVYAKVAYQPFKATYKGQEKNYSYGTVLVPVSDQEIDAERLFALIQEAAELAGVSFDALSSGYSATGVGLGSRSFQTLSLPKVMMIVGEGIMYTEAGEVWHLLDSKVGMPVTKVDKNDIGQLNLNDYTTVMLVHGNYNDVPDSFVDQLKSWIREGGTLITQKGATSWAISKGIVKEKLADNKEEVKTGRKDYETSRNFYGAQSIGGVIFEADLDITNPIGFGFTSRKILVYRNSSIFLKPSESPFRTVAQYTAQPWVAGFVTPSNIEKVKASASILLDGSGQGRAILFTDNPNFRGYWYGTNKLFLNALFFGSTISVP